MATLNHQKQRRVINGNKHCRKCDSAKSLIEFRMNYDSRLGKKYIDSYCKSCRYLISKEWKKSNPKKAAKNTRDTNLRRKIAIMSHYSGLDKPECKYCGYSDLRALCLDHIHNDGYKNRMSGTKFYLWIKENEYPTGFQVLCANCNLIKAIECRRSHLFSPRELIS